MELRIGRVGPDRVADLELREREARAALAAAIKAPFEQVVVSHGAAEAARCAALEVLGARAGSDAGARSRVLLIDGLSAPVAAAIEGVARATGVEVDVLPLAPQILGGDVALVAMAHVDQLGRLTDPAPVAAAAGRVDARLLVDASLSVGALPVEVPALGADILIADVHRWLLGPDGVALLWLAPTLGEDTPERLRAASGLFGRGMLLATARSLGWLLMYVELPWVLARTERLARRFREALAGFEGVSLLGSPDGDATPAPPAALSALVAFRIAGWDAEQAAEELSRSVFAIVEADAEADLIRASVAAWNREDELDRFVERVAELAGHTPQDLPRKPSLTVINGPSGGEKRR